MINFEEVKNKFIAPKEPKIFGKVRTTFDPSTNQYEVTISDLSETASKISQNDQLYCILEYEDWGCVRKSFNRIGKKGRKSPEGYQRYLEATNYSHWRKSGKSGWRENDGTNPIMRPVFGLRQEDSISFRINKSDIDNIGRDASRGDGEYGPLLENPYTSKHHLLKLANNGTGTHTFINPWDENEIVKMRFYLCSYGYGSGSYAGRHGFFYLKTDTNVFDYEYNK